jgi:hypothetical protein
MEKDLKTAFDQVHNAFHNAYKKALIFGKRIKKH